MELVHWGAVVCATADLLRLLRGSPDRSDMSVYLCVMNPSTDHDYAGLEITSVEFDAFRQYVARHVDGEFPTLMGFHIWDGEWSSQEAMRLSIETQVIAQELGRLPVPRSLRRNARAIARDRQAEVPRSMNGYFMDHDGQPLAVALRGLAEHCIALGLVIRSQ